MRRRDFITLLGGGAAWPFAARAQPTAMPVVGLLDDESPEISSTRLSAFRRGLSEIGYVEGRNVAIEYRAAEGQYDRLPALAADLVRRRVSVIASLSTIVGARAAKAATTTIPIVFYTGADPVAVGLVASLNRPGGNLTGVTTLNVEIGPKRPELLHEMVPTAASIAVLVNPTNPIAAETNVKDLAAAARTLGLQLHFLHASTERDFDTVFSSVTQLRAGALMIGADAFFIRRSEQLGALTARHAIPSTSSERGFVAAGGLMSYGNSGNQFRLVGVYTGRILSGEKPADLPVQQSTKVELVINLKTAKALGLTVSNQMQLLADEVIE
jgi:putative ABC transport system substrate-binding protein